MRARTRGRHLVALTTLVAAAIVAAAPSTASAGERMPTPAQLDKGLLTTGDLFPIFEETDRRPLDASELAADDRGPCGGPNTMAHAVALDEQVDVVTAAFGTEAGAALTEDLFSFASPKQAKSFVKKNAQQLKTCDSWQGLLSGATREFEIESVRAPKLGNQAVEANVFVAPVSTTATGFDGELIRQTTYVRVGSVVATLLYLRSVDFSRTTPGRGFPKSAVTALEDAL